MQVVFLLESQQREHFVVVEGDVPVPAHFSLELSTICDSHVISFKEGCQIES